MKLKIIIVSLLFCTNILFAANSHPKLLLTSKGAKEIRKNLSKTTGFDQSYLELKTIADQALNTPITVPQPIDGGGGYSHEKHKNNYYEMNACGLLFQITGNTQYAIFVRNMLNEYANIYTTLPLHPVVRSKTPGKLFWQALNEAVWLVHTSVAYDCIYNFLSIEERNHLEKNLFRPMAEFLSNGNKANYDVFNMMHNHGTWATAAVGMIAYVMGDKNLSDMALYGSNKDGKTGFIRQLDYLFSPVGYFTEGPYYQRYSIWPFMTFAQVIQNNQPELNIFKYRDGILFKAVDVMLQSAYNGEILYLNDALYKTYKTQELVYAVNIAFHNDPTNTQLLDIASQQGAFIIADAGITAAKALSKKKKSPYNFRSMLLTDGYDGTHGGIALMRHGKDDKQMLLTFKATSHGLSHGHYDKLSISMFYNGDEILADYGAVRFLNIEPKFGGHYTRENYSWAMQTITHNTLTIDEQSHFDANIKVSSDYHSDINYFNFDNENLQVVSGSEDNAYPFAKMKRTLALVKIDELNDPLIIDIFNVNSSKPVQMDFPFHYKGHLVSTSFKFDKMTDKLETLGKANGYQHLWIEATAKANAAKTACFTWVKSDKFYSITSLVNDDTEFLHTRLGANDPNFNFRPEAAYIMRQKNTAKHSFINIIEPHGSYDLTKEITRNYASAISNLQLLLDDDQFTVLTFNIKADAYIFAAIKADFDNNKQRVLNINDKNIAFKGNYYFTKI